MSIKVIRFDDGGTPRWGVVIGARVQPLELDARSTAELMSNGLELARAAAAEPAPDRDLAGLQLLCPVTPDRQLIAQGLNYSSHLREIGIPSGKLPFNTDGGGMCNNHPVNRGGITKIIEAVRQLRGTAGARQIAGARLALVSGHGLGMNTHASLVLGG